MSLFSGRNDGERQINWQQITPKIRVLGFQQEIKSEKDNIFTDRKRIFPD